MEMDEFRKSIWKKIDTIEKCQVEMKLQIGRIASHVESEQGTMIRGFESVHKDLNNINTFIHGNGEDGVKTKVRVLEDKFKNHMWNIRAIWVAMLSAGIPIVWNVISRGIYTQ